MPDIADHQRVNDSLLAGAERPLLRWLGRLAARRISSDRCTAIGVGGAVLALIAYLLSNIVIGFLWLASIGVLLHWLGDSLAGTVARHRREDRPRYGFFIDNFTDAICLVLLFVGLGLSPYVNFTVACLSLVSYQLLTIMVLLRTCVADEFRVSFGKLGPTEAHVLLILLNIVMIYAGPAGFLYTAVVGGFGLLTAFFFARTGWRETVRLAPFIR